MGSRLIRLAALAAAAVLVWSVAHDLAPLARLWSIFLLLILPPIAIAQARMLTQLGDIPTESIYASSMISLWLLAGLTAIVAWTDLPVALHAPPLLTTLAWAGAATAAGIILLAGGHRLGLREAAILHRLLPSSNRQKALFAGVSITAGFCEEFVFRGFLLGALERVTGSTALAVLVSSATFGLLHAYQRVAGALRAGLLGAILALPVVATGSLIPSIIAHAAIDLLAGLWLRDRLLR